MPNETVCSGSGDSLQYRFGECDVFVAFMTNELLLELSNSSLFMIDE